MWAIRRAANPIRSRTHRIVACIASPEIRSEQAPHDASACGVVLAKPSIRDFPKSAGLFLWSRNLSSEAGAKSSDGEEVEEDFSELDVSPGDASPGADKVEDLVNKEDDNVLVSEEEPDEDVDGPLGLVLDDAYGAEGMAKKRVNSPIFRSLIDTRQPVGITLKKWTEEGKSLGRDEVMLAMIYLRKRRFYSTALQFMEWLDENKRMDFTERDYASYLDLTAKVHGLYRAEKYIDKIPEQFRGEVIYRTLLANCVGRENTRKAEEVFNKIRDLRFPLTVFVCNQMILLYKRTDRKKVADILKLMEQEDVEPSLFTYKLLIAMKGRAYDVAGMEELLEMMKSKGMEPDLVILAIVARHCIFGRHKERAEEIMKQMEGEDINENRIACRLLLPLYAVLGKDADVERIWKACEADPRLDECLAAIEAWGEVGRVAKAEEVFEHMVKTYRRLSSKYYNVMLKVYAKHKHLAKGKEVAKRMVDDGCKIGPLTWDALVKLYVEAGEVEKADSVLQKAVQHNQLRPLFSSYMTVMSKYAEKGDVHNTEKIFLKLKQTGYIGRMTQYQTLLQAYVNAKVPAYGFRDRMKADNIYPNRTVAAQLVSVDAFRKTPISQLLD